MELLKFIANNVLGPVFDHDLAMVRTRQVHAEGHHDTPAGSLCNESGGDGNQASQRAKIKQISRSSRSSVSARNAGDAILDPNGPRLIDGIQNWILFYQLTGFINISRMPLYLALIYRLVVYMLANYIVNTHFVVKMVFSSYLGNNHANPIFAVMNILSHSIVFINSIVIFYKSTFDLCPLFKTLTTPKLCYINRRTQKALGDDTLVYMLVFYVYHSVLYRMLVHENFEQFIHEFNLGEFLLEYYAIVVWMYNIVGLAHLDFYVRTCFGAWLLALGTNIECRQARISYLKLQNSSPSLGTPQVFAQTQRASDRMSEFHKFYLFVSPDDIQRSLNAMDDHLEVTRTIQTISLVLINLLSFLGCGLFFLMAYNALAKSHDHYHGIILGLVSLNYTLLVMLTYLGDGFIYYALAKLVQTIEDEYFVQKTELALEPLDAAHPTSVHAPELSGAREETTTERRLGHGALPIEQAMGRVNGEVVVERADSNVSMAPTLRADNYERVLSKQILPIKRSNVLFCRELLVQFENHLATPWSNLTFKSHLQIMGTFATLIAAQIIFEAH